MRILIVDDSPVIRKMVRYFLSDIAQQVEECADGANALAAYEEHLPDWVLMDLSMPHVDGLTAMRGLLAAHPEARVAILTQYDSLALREAATQAGAREYLLKDDLTPLRSLLVGP